MDNIQQSSSVASVQIKEPNNIQLINEINNVLIELLKSNETFDSIRHDKYRELIIKHQNFIKNHDLDNPTKDTLIEFHEIKEWRIEYINHIFKHSRIINDNDFENNCYLCSTIYFKQVISRLHTLETNISRKVIDDIPCDGDYSERGFMGNTWGCYKFS